jgi:phage shock protein PspC (stress-responsive transcriptional regulator)
MILELRDEPSTLRRPLRRSLNKRVIAGVCGGVSDWLGQDVRLVRFGFLLLAVVTSVVPAALLYGLLALFVPEDRSPRAYLEYWNDPPRW